MVVVVGVTLPFAVPYTRKAEDSTLSERMQEAKESGEQLLPMDFIHPAKGTLLGQLLPNERYWIWGEKTLYIGFVTLVLALLGFAYGPKSTLEILSWIDKYSSWQVLTLSANEQIVILHRASK